MTKILIIEDNESARENINDILELEGFETLMALHGQQGLDLAKEHTPDLIVCDVNMPRLNGYEVLEALGGDPTLAEVPFIFLTAKSTQHDFRQGMTLGSNDYLTKPFSPSDLVSAVRAQLKKKQSVTQIYQQKIDQLEHAIDELSQIDMLTQLPNQLSLNQALAQVTKAESPLALFVISIDQFSFLSSTLATDDCDSLIKLVAQRIQNIFPQAKTIADLRRIFRTSHSQFVILTDQDSLENAPVAQTAERVINFLRAPYVISGHTVNVTFSIGIASTAIASQTTTGQLTAPSSILQDAKIALYKVQQEGGNHYRCYSPEMSLNVFERLDIANALHYALQQGEFEVYYQPQLELSQDQVVGVEALVRWHSEQLGWVSPNKFIPVAEENGLINQIGNWVLFTACSQAKQWQEQFQNPIRVSVNLSPVQLAQAGLSDTVRVILQKTHVSPHLLCLEITEKALIQNERRTIQTLRELKKMGVRIAIDDFGTGYAGLEYLSTFPCNTIKVDRMFVQNIHQRYTNQKIVAAVMNMSHDLNLNVVAEGAETGEELAYLKSLGCDVVQGFIFAKPLTAVAATAFVNSLQRQGSSV
ncbi:MAG: EAL domain-containing protein [Leptolyngbyaceae cyanobacterium]